MVIGKIFLGILIAANTFIHCGLINRIIHEYSNVDLDIIYDTVKEDIYVIEKLFKSID